MSKQKSRKKSVMHSSKLSIKESVMGACTNFMYKLGGYGGIRHVPKILKQNEEFSSEIVILGKNYTEPCLAEEAMQNLIWFTYRDKIKLTEDLNSDVGWGCLPRVGQMLLAQTIIKHYQSSGKIITKSLKKNLIEHFIDSEEQEKAQYSLSNILKYARWKFMISPGEWFNIGQISEVLRKIHEETPLSGTDNLKLVIFSQSVIFNNEIVEKSGFSLCSCQLKSSLFCEVCHKKSPLTFQKQQKHKKKKIFQPDSEQTQSRSQKIFQVIDNSTIKNYSKSNSFEVKQEVQNSLQNHLLLIVSVRTSEKKVSENDFKSIVSLLSLPTSMGALGGVPSKALYFIGYQNSTLLYLDPHFVQQFVPREKVEEEYQTFFCHNYRTLSRQDLDPSMAFCFYLKTMEEAQELILKINELKKLHEARDQSFFVSTMDSDNFSQQINIFKYSSFQNSMEFRNSESHNNSLEFRDLTDSY